MDPVNKENVSLSILVTVRQLKQFVWQDWLTSSMLLWKLLPLIIKANIYTANIQDVNPQVVSCELHFV